MTSKRQFAANQQNALKSTGPRSEEGKERSRANAVKHGLTAATVLLPGEDPAKYEQLCLAFYQEWNPVTPSQCELVDHAVDLCWRLRRVPGAEAHLFQWIKHVRAEQDRRQAYWKTQRSVHTSGPIYLGRNLTEDMDPADRERLEIGRAFEDLLKSDVISKLSRYEVTLQRQLSSTLAELRQVMASRPEPAPLKRPSVMQLPFRPQAEPQPAAGTETTGSDPRDELLVG